MTSSLLQMGPGGMMPTGWDWGPMWFMMLIPGLALVVAIVVVVLLLTRQNRPQISYASPPNPPVQLQPEQPKTLTGPQQSSPKNDIMGKVVLSLSPTLTDDERRVMDELAKAGGEMLQSDLPKMTDYSKATVSKAIHGLEVRGIIVRERHKWTYWCKVNPRLVERVQQPS